MDLRQLRYFLEMAEQGSLSEAAKRLNVSQSALSIHLRNMEAELGGRLLVRQRSGVVPTEAGEALARHARIMLAQHSRGLDEIRGMDSTPAGEVRLGLPGTISDILTVPLIQAAMCRYPQIRLTVSEAMSGFVATWLRDGRIDLGVLYTGFDEPDIQALRLIDEELVVLAAPGHLRSRQTSFAALAGQQLILPSRAHGLRQMLDAAAALEGQTLSPAIEIDSYKNIKDLVELGIGTSILPMQAVEAERIAGKLITQTFSGPGLWRSVYLVNRTARPLTRALQAIHALTGEQVTEAMRNGKWPGARLAPASAV